MFGVLLEPEELETVPAALFWLNVSYVTVRKKKKFHLNMLRERFTEASDK